jgi:hypothetical protein
LAEEVGDIIPLKKYENSQKIRPGRLDPRRGAGYKIFVEDK